MKRKLYVTNVTSVACSSDKTNSFATSNLCKHLKVHHTEKFKQLEESEKAAKAASKESSQNPSTL